jgi:hypothetical protein
MHKRKGGIIRQKEKKKGGIIRGKRSVNVGNYVPLT